MIRLGYRYLWPLWLQYHFYGLKATTLCRDNSCPPYDSEKQFIDSAVIFGGILRLLSGRYTTIYHILIQPHKNLNH